MTTDVVVVAHKVTTDVELLPIERVSTAPGNRVRRRDRRRQFLLLFSPTCVFRLLLYQPSYFGGECLFRFCELICLNYQKHVCVGAHAE